MKSFLKFTIRVFMGKISMFLVVLNWILLIYVTIQRGGIERLQFHSLNDSLWMQIFLLFNFPSALISGLLFLLTGLLLSLLGVPLKDKIWWIDTFVFSIFCLLFIFCISFQWALIGYGIEKLIKRRDAIKK